MSLSALSYGIQYLIKWKPFFHMCYKGGKLQVEKNRERPLPFHHCFSPVSPQRWLFTILVNWIMFDTGPGPGRGHSSVCMNDEMNPKMA